MAVWYQCREIQMDQCKRIQNPEKDSYTCANLIYARTGMQISGYWMHMQKMVWDNWVSILEKKKLNPNLTAQQIWRQNFSKTFRRKYTRISLWPFSGEGFLRHTFKKFKPEREGLLSLLILKLRPPVNQHIVKKRNYIFKRLIYVEIFATHLTKKTLVYNIQKKKTTNQKQEDMIDRYRVDR